MQYETKEITLKNGKNAVFRSPIPEDAPQMLTYLRTTAAESVYLLRYPEECTMTVEQETAFLQRVNESPADVMIVCFVDGVLAGNCQLSMKTRIKTRHRGEVAIAIEQAYWNLGIGTAMFEEMIAIARSHGLTQLELAFIEGNDRAKHLYEKMGFSVVSAMPNAIRLKDGTMLKEFFMVKCL